MGDHTSKLSSPAWFWESKEENKVAMLDLLIS